MSIFYFIFIFKLNIKFILLSYFKLHFDLFFNKKIISILIKLIFKLNIIL